jgi:hypothetical protein
MKRVGGSEFALEEELAEMLSRYLDAGVFWTSLECRPRIRLASRAQQLRGVKVGVPD